MGTLLALASVSLGTTALFERTAFPEAIALTGSLFGTRRERDALAVHCHELLQGGVRVQFSGSLSHMST